MIIFRNVFLLKTLAIILVLSWNEPFNNIIISKWWHMIRINHTVIVIESIHVHRSSMIEHVQFSVDIVIITRDPKSSITRTSNIEIMTRINCLKILGCSFVTVFLKFSKPHLNSMSWVELNWIPLHILFPTNSQVFYYLFSFVLNLCFFFSLLPIDLSLVKIFYFLSLFIFNY